MKVNCCLTLDQETLALLDAAATDLQLPRSHVVEEILLDHLSDGELTAMVNAIARRVALRVIGRLFGQPDQKKELSDAKRHDGAAQARVFDG